MYLVDRYTYRVFWSDEDQEFIGLCAEFPSLSWLDESDAKALHGIKNVVREVLQDMESTDESPPVPITEKPYSGEIRVRMPPALHRRLALQAAEEKTSINKLIVRQLS
jgi:predicted HicB family RNase H-like nuclease